MPPLWLVAYLMMERNMTLVDVMAAVQLTFKARPWILTNKSFVRQLAYLEVKGKKYYYMNQILLREKEVSEQKQIETMTTQETLEAPARSTTIEDLVDIV